MLRGRLQFAGRLLGEVGIEGVKAINARVSGSSRQTENVAPRGSRHANYIDAGGAENELTFTISRQFASAHAAEAFEFKESTRLANLPGGSLRYDTPRNTFAVPDAQSPSIAHERKGVNVATTYTFQCGRIITEWPLTAKINGVNTRLIVRLPHGPSYLTAEKLP